MKKIPSLFKRDYEETHLVYDEVVEGCEWVQAGEGVATEKIDGTACMVRNGVLYKRFDRKQNKPAPEGWEACEEAPNEHTGHWPGWVPVGDSPEDRWHREAYEIMNLPDGTYELIGPKIQGNPYKTVTHMLIRHGAYTLAGIPTDFDGLKQYLSLDNVEGIVWHHPDGRMAKIKRRDFGLDWPLTNK